MKYIINMNTESSCNLELNMQEETPTYSQLYYCTRQVICLLPETCRKILTITLPKKIENNELLYKTFSESVQLQFNTSKSYIMSIRGRFENLYKLELGISEVEDNSKEYIYDIVFIIVPKELIYKLENEGVHCIKYFVGKSQNSKEFKILDRIPTLDMISTTTDNNIKVPFSFRVNIS